MVPALEAKNRHVIEQPCLSFRLPSAVFKSARALSNLWLAGLQWSVAPSTDTEDTMPG
jgi:hypothetical protein